MKRFSFFFLAIILIMQMQVLTTSCANIIPPSGGKKDTLPPVLVNATPKDSTVNFNGKRITLNFNEFIDLKDVQNNLLFTPIFENVPVIEARLRTLNIKLRDTLEPNTTYTFNFGNAIQDINEGNIARNFVYSFSTGPALDSLQIRGRVILAESGKTDSTLLILLHRSRDDSAVVKQRPRYAARVDSLGYFTFRFLPKDTFAIYALGDAGISKRYTNPTQTFAFADKPVVSGGDSTILLLAYKEEAEEKKSRSGSGGASASKEKRLKFTPGSSGNVQDLLNDYTLTFERPLRSFDSTKMHFATDSTFTSVDQYRATLDSTKTILSLQTKWEENKAYHLIIEKDFAEDTLGRKLLKDDTLSFTTRKLSDYGKLRIRIRDIDTASQPVLLFFQNDKVVFSIPVKSGMLTRDMFNPGDYELRMLFDANKNGKWDPGQFFGTIKQQPELIRPIDRKLIVKANWENELEITAPGSSINFNTPPAVKSERQRVVSRP